MAPSPGKRAPRASGANKAAASAAGAAGKGDDLRRALAWLESYPKVCPACRIVASSQERRKFSSPSCQRFSNGELEHVPPGGVHCSTTGGSGAAFHSTAHSLLRLQVSRWMARYDVEALVDAAGGLAVVPGFLPPFVAEGALRIMERLPPGR